MKSRVHPTYKTKYHVQNWASYDRALVRRGDITIWLSPEAIAAWEPDGAGTRGAQRKYSDLAIESPLTLRLLFHLPLRQAEGFLASLFVLRGLDLRSPDHTTLSRRGQHLDLTLRGVPRRAGLHLMIDSTGLSIVGEGEWAAAKHGGRGTRGWKKLHVGVDDTGVIVAHVLTDATADDATTEPSIEGVAKSQRLSGKGYRAFFLPLLSPLDIYSYASPDCQNAPDLLLPLKRLPEPRPQSSARLDENTQKFGTWTVPVQCNFQQTRFVSVILRRETAAVHVVRGVDLAGAGAPINACARPPGPAPRGPGAWPDGARRHDHHRDA